MKTLPKYIMGINDKGEIIPKQWSGGTWYKVSEVEEALRSTSTNTSSPKFPECSNTCKVLDHLGTGECESVCPDKFGKQRV